MSFLYRFFSISHRWANVSLVQLRDELAKRGLKRTGTREQLIERLQSSDVLRQAAQTMPDEEPLENSHLQNLSKQHIFQEILRRKPNLNLNQRTTKAQMIEILQNILLESRSPQIEVRDLRSLIMAVRQSPESVPSSQICEIFEQLTDPYLIPQLELNMLRHSDNGMLQPIWHILYKDLETFSKNQMMVIVQFISLLKGLFKIEYEAGWISDDFEERLLRQLSLKPQDLDLVELCKLVEASESNYEIESFFRNQVERNIKDALNLDVYDQLSVIDSLPLSCYENNKEVLDQLIKNVYNKRIQPQYERRLRSLYSIHNIGAPIPLELVQQIDKMPKDVFKRITPSSIFQIAEILGNQGKLSEDLMDKMVIILSAHNFVDSDGLELYVDFLDTINKQGNFHLLLTRPHIIERCISGLENMKLETLLKFSNCYMHHTGSEILINHLLKTLQNQAEINEYLSYIEGILNGLVCISEEKPIFTYQFESYQQIYSKERETLAEILCQYLNLDDHIETICNYYASELCTKFLSDEIFEREITAGNVHKLAEVYSKFHPQIDRSKRDQYGINILKAAINLDIKNRCRIAFLISKSQMHEQDQSVDSFISQQQIKQLCLEILNLEQDVNLCLAILYNLKLSPEKATLQSFIKNKVIPQLHTKSLYGEELLKTIVMLSNLNIRQAVLQAITNLRFWPERGPKLEQETIHQFLNIVNSLQSSIQDWESLGLFFLQIVDQIGDENAQLLMQILKPYQNLVDQRLILRLQQQTKGSSTGDTLARENRLELLQQSQIPSIENLNIVYKASASRLGSGIKIHDYIKLLDTSSQESDQVEILEALYDYASKIGLQDDQVTYLNQFFNKRSIIQRCSKNLLTNYAFINSIDPKQFQLVNKKAIEIIQSEFKDQLSAKYINPKSQLECFSAFTYNTILEPRKLSSNNQLYRSQSPEFSNAPTMAPQEISHYLKVNAIYNTLNEPKPDQTVDAINFYYNQIMNNQETISFTRDFLEFLNLHGSLKQLDKKIQTFLDNEKTLWKATIGFPQHRVGIMYTVSQDQIYNEKGEEIGAVFMDKLIRSQLEKIGRWRTVIVRHSTWSGMAQEGKLNFVRQLQQRLRLV